MRQRILHEFYEWPRKDAVAFDSEHRANSVRRIVTGSYNTFHIFYIYFCIVPCKFHSFHHGYVRALDRRSGISGEVTFYIGWNWNVFFYHHSDSWKYLNTLPPNAFIDISCVFCDVNTNSNYVTVDIFLKTFEMLERNRRSCSILLLPCRKANAEKRSFCCEPVNLEVKLYRIEETWKQFYKSQK